MASSAEHLGQPDMLRSYLRALARRGDPERELDRGRQIRTCARCGQRAIFTLETAGTWYRCTHCGRYA